MLLFVAPLTGAVSNLQALFAGMYLSTVTFPEIAAVAPSGCTLAVFETDDDFNMSPSFVVSVPAIMFIESTIPTELPGVIVHH